MSPDELHSPNAFNKSVDLEVIATPYFNKRDSATRACDLY